MSKKKKVTFPGGESVENQLDSGACSGALTHTVDVSHGGLEVPLLLMETKMTGRYSRWWSQDGVEWVGHREHGDCLI